MVRNSNLNWDEMQGSNTSYDSNQYSIFINWNSRHVANLIFSVFVYYNLAIKHTVYNSVIWSDADVLILCWFIFSFLHFRLNENPSIIFEYWLFVFWIPKKNCSKNCPKTCSCPFQTNSSFISSFITVS